MDFGIIKTMIKFPSPLLPLSVISNPSVMFVYKLKCLLRYGFGDAPGVLFRYPGHALFYPFPYEPPPRLILNCHFLLTLHTRLNHITT